MIQQQLIMHGIPFEPDSTRQELAMIVDNPENKRKLESVVNDQTIKKRLKDYKEEHGDLPIVIYTNQPAKATASSSNNAPTEGGASSSNDPQPQAKAKAKAKAKASSSNEPPPPPQGEPRALNVEVISSSSSSGGEEQTFDLMNQAPLRPPSRIGLQEVRNFVKDAYNKRKFPAADLNKYHTNMDISTYKSADKKERNKMLEVLRDLYKRYVYDPHKEKVKKQKRAEKKSSIKSVKKSNIK